MFLPAMTHKSVAKAPRARESRAGSQQTNLASPPALPHALLERNLDEKRRKASAPKASLSTRVLRSRCGAHAAAMTSGEGEVTFPIGSK